jgi:hypothetical protein
MPLVPIRRNEESQVSASGGACGGTVFAGIIGPIEPAAAGDRVNGPGIPRGDEDGS